jgi:hypothetical protein
MTTALEQRQQRQRQRQRRWQRQHGPDAAGAARAHPWPLSRLQLHVWLVTVGACSTRVACHAPAAARNCPTAAHARTTTHAPRVLAAEVLLCQPQGVVGDLQPETNKGGRPDVPHVVCRAS